MPSYDQELLSIAQDLVPRGSGQRGRLPTARIRRSISTSYYALFHFILEEVGLSVVGTRGDLRSRRRILARTISHAGIKAALDKVRGSPVDASVVADFLRPSGSGAATGSAHAPAFARSLASAFADSQSKRHDADYDMNKQLSVADARLLQSRVRNVIAQWRGARSRSDRDFKHALCLLILMNGKLRS